MDRALVLDEAYWTERYERNETGWDIGYVSTPIKEYVDQLKDKNVRILIPGGGNSYEAEHLWRKGFQNVFVVDISWTPLEHLKLRVPDFPEDQLIHGDFFDLQDTFDLIIEQTFFCALNPEFRKDYVNKVSQLLKPGGKLVGLLFQIPLNKERPPFGGNREEYRRLFSDKFTIEIMETAYNSIAPRMGNELFVKMLNVEC